MRTSIERIASERLVENLISSMRCSVGQRKDNLQDLAQDIYLELMERETLPDTYAELKYLIVRIILNNINSRTSRYYARYRKAELERIDGNVQLGQLDYDAGTGTFAPCEDRDMEGPDGD